MARPPFKSAFPRRRVLLIQASWLDRVLHGVAKYALEHNWIVDCHVQWTRDLPSNSWHGDGIIVYADNSKKIIDFVNRANVPVVDFEAFKCPFPGAPKVITSDQAIGEMAAEHLLSLGFKALGTVGFVGHQIEVRRLQSFRDTVAKHGVPVYELNLENLGQELHKLPRPMGLFAANDLNAIEVIRVCENEGFRVPEDIAVLGVDDVAPLCELASTPLSSINLNFEQKGYEAAAILDRLMSGEKPTGTLVVPPRGLTLRRSTNTLAIPQPEAASALRFIRDHFREPIRINDVAAHLSGSLRTVQAAFRKHVGRSMQEELTRLRVEHAKELLANPKSKLDAIALECGFSSRFHFIKAFRRVTGQTPNAFRPENKKSQG